MITPRFSLSQTSTHLIITIYAPFTNVGETEIFMDETDFRFFSRPYFLRLHLPGSIEETDAASAKYDADSNSFIVNAPKKNVGEFFEGLDMLTSLLTPKGATKLDEPGIEVTSKADENDDDEDEIDWYYDQQVVSEEEEVEEGIRKDLDGYGFAFSHSGVYEKLLFECQEILDVKHPDKLSYTDRRNQRLEMESKAFSEDHYLCDLFGDENDEIDGLIKTEPVINGSSFTKEEEERMISLPHKKEYIVQKQDLNSVYFSLIDILFAYSYDLRTTENEHCSESGWTICKLCSSLVCSEKFLRLKDLVVACIRRSLCFPLYRRWDLSVKVFQDVVDILKAGKIAVLKILLDIIPILNEYEGRYIFNQLFVEPMAVWIQRVNPVRLNSLASALEKTLTDVSKADLDLDIPELEQAARICQEEAKINDISKNIAHMSINKTNLVAENDSDDDSSEYESDSDSNSSESSDYESDSDSESE